MGMKRREFIRTLGAGTVGAVGLKALGDVTTDGDPNTSYSPHVH